MSEEKGYETLKKESKDSLLDQDAMNPAYKQLKKEQAQKDMMDKKNMGASNGKKDV